MEGPHHYFSDLIASSANDIPYAAHAALENCDARTIGGSPPALLCTLPVAPDRDGIPDRRGLLFARADRGHRVRLDVGSPILGFVLTHFFQPNRHPLHLKTLRYGHAA